MERSAMKGFRSFLFFRSAKYWLNLLITVLISLGIAISIEIIGYTYNKRVDLTSEMRYNVSDQLKKILRSLGGTVAVKVFYQSGERMELNDLLSQFSSQSPNFHYELLDLDRNPAEARKYGINNYRETVIEYEGKRTKIPYPAEDRIINSIIKLTRKEKKVLYFLRGHGENDILDSDPRKGYSRIREALESDDYEVKELGLAGSEEIIRGASVLIVSGPKRDFLERELEVLRKFVLEGGRVLFMIDPLYPLPKLSAFLLGFGVVLGRDVIADPYNRAYGGDEFTILVPLFLKHPIIQDFRIPALFPLARSIEVKETSKTGVFAQTFAESDPKSWAVPEEKDFTKGKTRLPEGVKRKGPISVAAIVAIESRLRKGEKEENTLEEQMVVFGDSDFINNFYINLLGNKDLFLNTINWLSEDEYLISSRPKKPEYAYRPLKFQETKGLFWFLVILLPALPLVVGVVVYIRRRIRG
jgi:hypothetical protein